MFSAWSSLASCYYFSVLGVAICWTPGRRNRAPRNDNSSFIKLQVLRGVLPVTGERTSEWRQQSLLISSVAVTSEFSFPVLKGAESLTHSAISSIWVHWCADVGMPRAA